MFPSTTLLAPSDRRPVRERRVVHCRWAASPHDVPDPSLAHVVLAASRPDVVLAASVSADYDVDGRGDRAGWRRDEVGGLRDDPGGPESWTPHDRSTVHDRTAAIAALGLTSETDAPDGATSAAMGLASEGPGSTTASGATGGSQELATALDTLREQVSGLAAAVPERAQPEQVDTWLASFRRLEGAVAGLRTRLVGCVQLSRAHEGGGHAAPTTYLKEALGVSGREAARQDKLARDLRGLPQTQQALTDGDIGPEQAQAIGRSAHIRGVGRPWRDRDPVAPASARSRSGGPLG